MISNSPNQKQIDLFNNHLSNWIDLRHPLILLAEKIPWQKIEKAFDGLYSHTGSPAKAIRRMAGLLILKYLFNLSDERLVALWKENIYFQYFCGEAYIQKTPPCAASDLVHFRNRIGEKGVTQLFSISIGLHAKKIKKSHTLLVDTTVQEKNITYPTDSKLYYKIIMKCNKIAKKVGIKLRQTYHRSAKKLQLTCNHISIKKKAFRTSLRKLKTLASRQLRDLTRKLKKENLGLLSHYQPVLKLFNKVLCQQKGDKGKIYSLHEPQVSCIVKGKKHKRYEYGNKVSIAALAGSHVIVGLKSFQIPHHDSKSLSPTLSQVKELTGQVYKQVVVDRGYRGHPEVEGSQVILPGNGKGSSPYQKRKRKKQFRQRAGIEGIISHVKQDHRMLRNYLKGNQGDTINGMLAAMGFNFKLWLRGMAKIFFYFLALPFRDIVQKLVALFFIFLSQRTFASS